MDKIELIKKEQKKLNTYRFNKIKKIVAILVAVAISIWVFFAQIYFLAISWRLTWFLVIPTLISDITLIYSFRKIIKYIPKRFNKQL
ncbi:MAG: hypothetical protein ACRCZN_00650 [Lactococcus lactis]